jgi:hypothetical protein
MATSTATHYRIHAAPSVGCGSCGAPLPVDPTALHVWCPMCWRWQAVPNDVRARAYEHLRATESLGAERAAQVARAEAHREAARKTKRQGTFMLFHAAFMIVPALVSFGVYAVVGSIDFLSSLSEEYEPWAVALVAVGGGGATLVGLLVTLGGGWALYRLFTRHQRLKRRGRSAEWFGKDQGSAGAMCGVCGAPVAFRVGETAVSCGYCRSVVVATEHHSRRLIGLALAQTQLARLEQAKAERQKIKAELVAKRRQQAYMAYAVAGTMALMALPVLLGLYVWRTVTHSIEEAMLMLSQRLSGAFGAGIDPAFEWLDVYWIGDTPRPLRETEPFQSRWSIEAVFHDRPVLVTATTSWSDRTAKQLALLMARPRDRASLTLDATPAAARCRARGFSLTSDYAGIALVRRNVPEREIDDALLTEIAQAAYELCEHSRA